MARGTHDQAPRPLLPREYAAVRADVTEMKAAWHARDQTRRAVDSRDEQGVRASLAGPGEPDLAARSAPRDALEARVIAGDRSFLPFPIDDRDRAAIIALDRVIGEGDERSIRRHAHVADVSGRLVDRLAGRKFHAILSVDEVGDRESRPIRQPVSVLNVLENIARGAPGQRSSRQGPDTRESANRAATENECQLSR